MFSPRFCIKILNIAKTKIKYINITQKHKMKYKAKYSHVWDNDVKPIQKPPQPTLYTCEELCSIPNKDNYSLLENTISPNIISKGFFQTAAQKALQNSEIEKAFEIAEQYIQISKRKFYRFLDMETKKIIISKQLNRFDAAYVFLAKQKLKGLQRIGSGYDIMHITLTISHAGNSDYIEKYRLLKNKFNDFMCFFKRVIKKKIDYVSTYEVTSANDGRFHQHIHLILIGIGYLPKKTVALLSAKWKKITNSRYIHFKYISRNRNVNIFSYIMKYVTKEFANINLTTVLLFSVKGKAYTMSQRLSRLISEKILEIGEKKYKYIDSFEVQDIFYGYNLSDYDPASLTFFFSFISVEEKTKLLSEGMQQAEARQKIQKEAEERDERDIEANKKNAIAIINIIKIK